MKRAGLTLLGALMLGLGGAVQATVIYDNGAPNQQAGNEMTEWIQTEDFTFTETTTITDIHFWSVDSGLFDGTITWQIYDDNGGNPGAVLFSGSATDTHTATGNVLFFGTEFTNDFLIGPITLGPGTYHLGLHNGPLTNTTREEFYWETTNPNATTTGLEDQAPFGDNSWFNNGDEHAYQLTGIAAAPEPATLALLGLGLAGLGFSRRSRRA